MVVCKDPTVTYLAEFGFNVIRLPRAGFGPGRVLVGDGPALDDLGGLEGVWAADQSPPALRGPEPAAVLQGRATGDFDTKLGVSVLAQLLSRLGVSGPKLEAAFAGARSLSFGFGAPSISSINVVELGSFLKAGKLASDNPIVMRYFGPKAPAVHVTTDVLTTSSMSVIATQAAEQKFEVDTAALQASVEARVAAKRLEHGSWQVSFDADVALAFGFRAIKLKVRDDRWSVVGFARPGAVFNAAPQPPRAWASTFPLGEVTVRSAETR